MKGNLRYKFAQVCHARWTSPSNAFRPSARACYPLARGSAHKTTVTFVGRSIGAILLRCRRRSERLSKYELVWRSIFMVQPAWRPSCIIRGRAVLGGR